MQRITIIFVFCIFICSNSFAQRIIILDSLTKSNIPYCIISDGKNEYVSNEDGSFDLDQTEFKKIISIKSLGYKKTDHIFPKSDTVIFLITNIVHLGEVIVTSKSNEYSIIGNYKKKSLNVLVNSIDKIDHKLKVVNSFKYNGEEIESFLFYIAKDDNYSKSVDRATLEIIFFSQNSSGLPDNLPFYKLAIKNYDLGWNKVSLKGIDLSKINGKLFYGINWVFDPVKYHYRNVTRKKVYTFFGPKIGTVNSTKSINDNHISLYYTDKFGWRVSNLTYVLFALEIIN
jgi:hypothetical protein